MGPQFRLGDIDVNVVFKDIRNVHLSVYPPTGRVQVSAPTRLKLDVIRVFVISRLGWIRQQQRRIRAQERETRREYTERESHYVWGRRYLLRLIEHEAAPQVELTHSRLRLFVRPGSDAQKRRAVLDGWYRERIREAAVPLLQRWEVIIGVRINRLLVQRMKTRWGGCNPQARNIRLNTDLARKPPACLEYILVHELAHLREPTHGPRFVALMDTLMPDWQQRRDALNRLPVRHDEWRY